MNTNEKSRSGNLDSNEKHSTTKSKGFLYADYRPLLRMNQCEHCASDYMRFAVNGYCQWCQQRAEYVIRERPATTRRVQGRGTDR